MIEQFHTNIACELPLDVLQTIGNPPVDCIVCDFQEFISNEKYKFFFQYTNRKIVLKGTPSKGEEDKYWETVNSIYNLIYYYIPFTEEKEIEAFYKRGIPPKALPIIFTSGKTLTELGMNIKSLHKKFPQAVIAVKSTEEAFNNSNNTVGYFNKKDISYEPIRRAFNRKLFMKGAVTDSPDCKFALVDCESLLEFDEWSPFKDTTPIALVDTNQPLYCSLYLNTNYSNYEDGFCIDGEVKVPSYYAKFPEPENWRDMKAEDILNTKFLENFKDFRRKIHHWES